MKEKKKRPEYLDRLHTLLDKILDAKYEPSSILHAMECNECLALLGEATRDVEEEEGEAEETLGLIHGYKDDDWGERNKIRHTLDNVDLEKLPEEEEIENEEKTIHGEK